MKLAKALLLGSAASLVAIGGKAEFDLEWDEPRAHSDPTVGYNALARVNLDARTATDWGLLRTFVQIDIRRRSGAWYGSGTSARQGFGVVYGGGVNPNNGFSSFAGANSFSPSMASSSSRASTSRRPSSNGAG